MDPGQPLKRPAILSFLVVYYYTPVVTPKAAAAAQESKKEGMRVVLCASPLKPRFHHLIQTPSSPLKLPAASPLQPRRLAAAAAARGPPPFSVIKSSRKPGTPDYLQVRHRQRQRQKEEEEEEEELPGASSSDGMMIRSRRAVLGAGLALLIMMDGPQEARALEGPLAEEFWENVRRYGLYILTVSTGAIYTIFQPIVELLKNPITAILILTVLAGGFYLVSQVVSAMIGLTNFTYDYGY